MESQRPGVSAVADGRGGAVGVSALPRRMAVRVLVPGLYAWFVTVALPAGQRDASLWPRLLSILAVLCLVSGPWLAVRRERVGRALGVFGFVGFSLLTWLVLGDLLSVGRLDPVRAALGSMGWALYAFGWGSVREVGTIPEKSPHVLSGAALTARSTLPAGAALVVTLGLLGSLVPIFLAWRVERPLHALFAHAVAIVAAIALVTAAATIGVSRGSRALHPARTRLQMAGSSIGLAVMLLSLGFMATLLW